MKMKNNIICCFMAIALTIVMNSCTDYPDIYGFNVNMSDTEQSLAVSPDGYNVTLKTPVYYDEGTGITKYGYIINGNEVPAEFVRTDNHNGYLTATISNLAYGNSYTVLPVIGDDTKQEYGQNIYLNLTKDLFFPQWVSSEMTMNADGEIVLTAVYSCPATGNTYKPINKATATFGGKEIEATVSEDGTTVNAIINDINSYAKGIYSYIDINATNDFGTTSLRWNYTAEVEDISQTYIDDGNKSDHISLCGIKWAKGNFIVENGNGRILSNQWNVVYGSGTQNNGAYFNATNGKNLSKKDFPLSGKLELKGNHEYDAVTEKLPDWGTPSYEDFDIIDSYASYQNCSVKTEDGSFVDGILFLSPKNSHKRFCSVSNNIIVKYDDVNKLGLFLPECGAFYRNPYLGKGNYFNTDYGYYTTSTIEISNKENSNYWNIGVMSPYIFRTVFPYQKDIKKWYNDDNIYYYFSIRPVRLK